MTPRILSSRHPVDQSDRMTRSYLVTLGCFGVVQQVSGLSGGLGDFVSAMAQVQLKSGRV